MFVIETWPIGDFSWHCRLRGQHDSMRMSSFMYTDEPFLLRQLVKWTERVDQTSIHGKCISGEKKPTCIS